MHKAVIAVLAAIVLVMLYKMLTCDCNKGKGWMGSVSNWSNPTTAAQDTFKAGQAA